VRQFEMSSAVPATVDSAWVVLSDISAWPEWSVLFPQADGRLVQGAVLDLAKRGASGEAEPFAPTVVSVDPPTRFVLEAGFGPSGSLRLVHTFLLEPVDPGTCVLRQTWVTDTPLDDGQWDAICAGMSRFEAFGEGLASFMAATQQAFGADSRELH
jgi:Polyketide cyclase / dehydrase and lipid transport